MSEKKISIVALSAFVMLWVAFKWTSLSLPYFWDEAWSYMPAISDMAGHQPCLIPGCIETEMYRGHPLFFYFLSSVWMKWIGGSLWSMHFFAMLISILAIISFYRVISLALSPYWSLAGAGLLILQEAFYVQSSFVLPEVLILLLTLECLRNYLNGSKFSFLIAAGMLGITKEIGVVIIFSFALYHLVKDKGIRYRSYWVYCSILPAVIYYILQKLMLGWYFYPLHLELLDISFRSLYSKAEIILKFIFFEQGRKALLVILGIVLIANLFLRDTRKYLLSIIAIIALSIFLYLHENIFSLIIYLLIILYHVPKFKGFTRMERDLFMLIVIICAACFAFCITNFLMLRYLLLFLPMMILMFMIGMHHIIPQRLLYAYALCIILILNFAWSFHWNFTKKGWHDDASINYINMVRVHQQVVEFCEEENWFDRKISTHFLLQQDLTNVAAGYLTTGSRFENASYKGNTEPDDEIVIFSSIELDEWKYNLIKDNSGYQLAKRCEINKAWAEIYMLKE